jgi:predicted nucleic acid-binding protein
MTGADELLIDTNVLLYEYDKNEPIKGQAALGLLQEIFRAGKPLLTTPKIISEFYWNVTRKIAIPLTHAEAMAAIQIYLGATRIQAVTWAVLAKAFDVINKHGLALWDAQLLAAAVIYGARTIVSEDFQHRAVLKGVTLINPFAADFVITDILRP